MSLRQLALAAALATLVLAGCVTPAAPGAEVDAAATRETSGYVVPAPDASLALLEHAELIPMPTGSDVSIHARIVRPDTDEPVPVIVEFTPYTAPGRAMLIEPQVAPAEGQFVQELVRRGFAFAFADVRGTGDSGGCLDLRGQMDIEDADALTEWLGTQPWSNGKVGFIGASYPGSEAHIAGLANNPHLGGVVPVVASTSFYHYHHKGGVPYSNHLATNTGYTAFATLPTLNPQNENYASRQAREVAECDQLTHLTVQADQSGAYTPWWADRNLRPRVEQVQVPVLMAQGLADWNVKPDHIATWWNDLQAPKTLIAGQWGHQFPEDAEEAYGAWWEFATAFFDQTLRGADTGRFTDDRAYVQANDGSWRTYATWPPLDATTLVANITPDGLSFTESPSGTLAWYANPASARMAEVPADEQVVLALPPLERAMLLAGTPRVNLTIISSAENVHLVASLEVKRDGVWKRENHGYLNPIYREGIDAPQRLVPGKATAVTIEMYPQEDAFAAGDELRLVLRSVDGGSTVPVFDEAQIEVVLDGERLGQLLLPLSPQAATAPATE